MKNSILIIISILFFQVAQAQNDQVYTIVEGLGCPFCANGLEKAFRDMKDKRDFNIDLEKGAMSFTMPIASKVSENDILTRVDKAGYTVKYIKITRSTGREIVWSADEEKQIAKEEKLYTEKIIGVNGNCGMCKTRIENAVNELEGIFFAYWNQETRKLHVRYDESIVTQKDIEQHIASVGHDTENIRAEDHVYENLHSCCLYDREQ